MNLEELNALILRKQIDKNVPIILPVGSMEVHGTHLPFGTDVFIVQAICMLISQRENVIVMPPVWYSLTDTTNELCGTINIPQQVIYKYIKSICLSLVENKFFRIIVLSIHGRNNLFLPAVVSEVFQETNLPIVYIDPYTCFAKDLDESILGRMHNHKKETTLLLASLKLLNLEARVNLSETEIKVEKPSFLKELLSVGSVGYFYNKDIEHISPQEGVSIEDGIKYLNKVAERIISLFGKITEYKHYIDQNPRNKKGYSPTK